jgi:imidazolonepropionase-like amidohydrolase
VDSLAAGGADFIKVYDALTRETFLAIADEAHRRGIPVDGHMPLLVPPPEGAAAGMRTVEHLSGITAGCASMADSLRGEYHAFLERMPGLRFPQSMIEFFTLIRALSDSRDPAFCARTVEAYQAAGVAVTPTVIAFAVDPHAVLADSVAMRGVPPAVRETWTEMAGSGLDALMASIMGPTLDTGRENLRLLHAAGVTILAGTDLGNPYLIPGVSLHDELSLLVENGQSPLEALRTATLNPAIVLGLADSLGAVAKGMVADLVFLRANPLENIRNTRSIEAVMVNGRYLDRAALDGLIARAGRSN